MTLFKQYLNNLSLFKMLLGGLSMKKNQIKLRTFENNDFLLKAYLKKKIYLMNKICYSCFTLLYLTLVRCFRWSGSKVQYFFSTRTIIHLSYTISFFKEILIKRSLIDQNCMKIFVDICKKSH